MGIACTRHGSTPPCQDNAQIPAVVLVHLAAIAGRVGITLDMAAFDRMGAETPVLVDLKPSGQH